MVLELSVQKEGQTMCTEFIGLKLRATFGVLPDIVMKFQVS